MAVRVSLGYSLMGLAVYVHDGVGTDVLLTDTGQQCRL